jgi:hypothetical protein
MTLRFIGGEFRARQAHELHCLFQESNLKAALVNRPSTNEPSLQMDLPFESGGPCTYFAALYARVAATPDNQVIGD